MEVPRIPEVIWVQVDVKPHPRYKREVLRNEFLSFVGTRAKDADLVSQAESIVKDTDIPSGRAVEVVLRIKDTHNRNILEFTLRKGMKSLKGYIPQVIRMYLYKDAQHGIRVLRHRNFVTLLVLVCSGLDAAINEALEHEDEKEYS